MALGTLTPVDNWVAAPHKPTAGDGGKATDMATILQDQADRSEFLRARRAAGISSSADDDIGSVAGPFTGDTNWHDCATVSKTITGTVGDTIPFLLTASVATNSSPANTTLIRLQCVDNAVTEYLDGCVQMVMADGGVHRIVFAGKHTMASTTAVLTLQVQNSNNAVNSEIIKGWSIVTL